MITLTVTFNDADGEGGRRVSVATDTTDPTPWEDMAAAYTAKQAEVMLNLVPPSPIFPVATTPAGPGIYWFRRDAKESFLPARVWESASGPLKMQLIGDREEYGINAWPECEWGGRVEVNRRGSCSQDKPDENVKVPQYIRRPDFGA